MDHTIYRDYITNRRSFIYCNLACAQCDRDCHCRVGLCSHNKRCSRLIHQRRNSIVPRGWWMPTTTTTTTVSALNDTDQPSRGCWSPPPLSVAIRSTQLGDCTPVPSQLSSNRTQAWVGMDVRTIESLRIIWYSPLSTQSWVWRRVGIYPFQLNRGFEGVLVLTPFNSFVGLKACWY